MFIYFNQALFNQTQATNLPEGKLLAPTSLQLGQLLTATVQTTKPHGLLQLAIGQQLLSAQSTLQHRVDQQLQLQVVSLDSPITLKILALDTQLAQILKQQHRQLLPKQNSQAPLLATLQALGKPQNKPQQMLIHHNIVKSMQTLQQSLPSLTQVTQARGLQNAIEQSGLLFEPQLLNSIKGKSPSGLSRDFKAQLLQLWSNLMSLKSTQKTPTSLVRTDNRANSNRPTSADHKTTTSETRQPNNKQTLSGSLTHKANIPTTIKPPFKGATPIPQAMQSANIAQMADSHSLVDDLLEQVLSSLARLQLHQIASLNTDPTNLINWLFELPIRHQHGTDIVHMNIEQEAKNNPDDEHHTWRIRLAFDLSQLGPMQVDLRLQGQTIIANIYAELQQTQQFVEQSLDSLHKSLDEEGLTLKQCLCQFGRAPDNVPKPNPPLLETKA